MRRAAALPYENAEHRHFQRRHLHKVPCDGLTLAPLLRFNAAESPGSIYKADDGSVKFFRLLHQTQGLAVALRHGHTEIPSLALLDILALMLGNDRHRLTVQKSQTADDGRIVPKSPVPVGFHKKIKYMLHIIRGLGPLYFADRLYLIPGIHRADFKGLLL